MLEKALRKGGGGMTAARLKVYSTQYIITGLHMCVA